MLTIRLGSPLFNFRTGAVHAIKWVLPRARYMTLETIAPMSDTPLARMPKMAG